MKLSTKQISHLRSLAQKRDAMLLMGKQGLTDGFIKMVDQALVDHELVKIRLSGLKDQRKTLAPQMADRTQSSLVTLLGHVVVLYRQQPDPAKRKVTLPAANAEAAGTVDPLAE